MGCYLHLSLGLYSSSSSWLSVLWAGRAHTVAASHTSNESCGDGAALPLKRGDMAPAAHPVRARAQVKAQREKDEARKRRRHWQLPNPQTTADNASKPVRVAI